MKRLLIISPYFPPSNAADMQRIRMSLPYFKQYGWEAEVVTVDSRHSEMAKDPLLTESVPAAIPIHRVKAFPKKWTSKVGLGSLALRSLWQYKRYVNRLLGQKPFDLVYFSTTQFPVCILGAYWKKKFGIPYVIDMHDPWHSTYYLDKPKKERPPKFWFSYRLNKYLEPLAMKRVDGLISVSGAYLETLHRRYPETRHLPQEVITFGAFEQDFDIARRHPELQPAFQRIPGCIHLVYVGRGGHDMRSAVLALFYSFKRLLGQYPDTFGLLRFHFIGTSYAPAGKGRETIKPLAEAAGISDFVEEQTERIPFYQTIKTLQEADALVVPGSDDPQYTASKLYPYILARKPLLGIFHPQSSACRIMQECHAGWVSNHDNTNLAIDMFLTHLAQGTWIQPHLNTDKFATYTADAMAKKQCALFDLVI